MFFSKMSISKRIISGYVVFFIMLMAITVFVITQNVMSLSRADTLGANGDSSTNINKALSIFLNARVGARVMMMSDSYSPDVYNSTKAQLDDALNFLNNGLALAEKYGMSQRKQLLSNTIPLVTKYSDTVTLLDEANARRKANKDGLPALGREAMTALDALLSHESEIFRTSMAAGASNLADTYDSLNELRNIEFEFYNARLLSTKLSYLNDITTYESIIESLNKVKDFIRTYSADLPASRKQDATAVLTAMDVYSAAFDSHRDILSQTEFYTNLCISTYEEVYSALEQADTVANQDLTNTIDKVLDSATSSLYTVIILMVLALIINIALALTIIKSITKALKSSMEKLKAATDNVITSSSELTSAANSLAQSSTEQAASIEETSATMNETTSMINQNNQNTHQAVELAKNSDASASMSVAQAEDMIEFMKKLNSSSDQISKVIATINSIASQTTILALNASVEAVRAGEAGRSFSVVAEEVRNLAQQSTLAVESTTAIIRENIELSKQGMESSKEVGNTLNEIHTGSEKVAQLLDEIATASDEQAHGVTQVNIAMSQMEKVTQSIAAVSEESAAAASELYNQASILEEVTSELGTLIGI